MKNGVGEGYRMRLRWGGSKFSQSETKVTRCPLIQEGKLEMKELLECFER